MVFPSSLGASYRKTRPCPRALRIQRDLRNLDSASRRSERNLTRLLQNILSALRDRSSSYEARLNMLQDLLSQLPPWTEWNARTDDLVESVYQFVERPHLGYDGKSMEHDVKEAGTPQRRVAERVLRDKLIAFNGGSEFIDEQAYQAEDVNLGRAFADWLRCDGDPTNHVKLIDGQWVSNQVLRRVFLRGGRLHIPTRTLEDPGSDSPPRTPPRRSALDRSRSSLSPTRPRSGSSPPHVHRMQTRSRAARRALDFQ